MSQAVAPLPNMLAAQTRAQFISLWRIPAFSITSLILPVMFFAFFGLPNVKYNYAGVNAGAYLLASFGAYAVSSMMVFNFGIGVAQERASKVDLLMRATPLPPLVYMLARLITAATFGVISVLILFAFGTVAGGVRLDAGTWLTIIGRLLLGSLPFIGMGFAIGYFFGVNAAPAVTNLVYLPLSFASGLFVPLSQMPDFIQKVAPYLPTYHYAQLAWNAVGAKSESLTTALLWLAAYTVAFFAIAMRAYRVEEARKFN
jgi:ABC-2 type transport system permease protein